MITYFASKILGPSTFFNMGQSTAQYCKQTKYFYNTRYAWKVVLTSTEHVDV